MTFAIGDWVYVMTNPHRGRKGIILRKRGYTYRYIEPVPRNKREFPSIVYRMSKNLYPADSDDPDNFVFCYCEMDERNNKEFACPYTGCYHQLQLLQLYA
jgi:hypothetical protein